ncbi:MAG: glutamate 5-kinase [Dehalococcoidia bacterium]|nr:glutamate 5-kinase [Dehalococcoidia bacterium]
MKPEQSLPDRYQRVVVKVGTNLLTAGTDRLDLEMMASLVGQIARLHGRGIEVILVSSGAIAAGRHRLGVKQDIKGIPFKQVLAAVGQSRLMYAYDQLFSWHGIIVAQTLLTRADLSDRLRYLNARNTLLALIELKVVGIVNENDVVAVDEIAEAKFGDNDNLSAMVANLVDADLLIILSDVDGLYTADPRVDPNAQRIPYVERVDAGIESLAGGVGSDLGRGGMATKIEAARLATCSGVGVVIAAGRETDVIGRLVRGERVGTYFSPREDRLESRKRWMLSGLSVKGVIVVDDGARKALMGQGKSLLPAGIVDLRGNFQRGDSVTVVDTEGRKLAFGIANYGHADLALIKGRHSDHIAEVLGYEYGDEIVHRNNLVVLADN